MTLLVLNILVLVLVSTAAALAYAQVLHLRSVDEWLAPPTVDYTALHAQWERERLARQGEARTEQEVAPAHGWPGALPRLDPAHGPHAGGA
jgi:hypothetical protein